MSLPRLLPRLLLLQQCLQQKHTPEISNFFEAYRLHILYCRHNQILKPLTMISDGLPQHWSCLISHLADLEEHHESSSLRRPTFYSA